VTAPRLVAAKLVRLNRRTRAGVNTTSAVLLGPQLGYGCAPDVLPALLTARQCLEVHASAKGLSAIGDDLLILADELRFTPYLEAFVDTLSLGTRQKLAVLLALVGDPLLIVLDEAFNGLDPASALILKRHLRARIERRGGALRLRAAHGDFEAALAAAIGGP
jgi:ABC-type multidrug transport system ATPase subunit